MKKQIAAAILTILMLMSIFPVSAFALTEGDYEYEYINDDTEVQITKYIGAGGEVFIPRKLDGKYVTSIGEYAFEDNSTVTYVWMSEYVTTVEKSGFANCTSLETVDFGNGLKDLGYGAFLNCVSLTSVVLPDSLTSVNDASCYDSGAFSGCKALKSAVIGNGLKKISGRTFYDCSSLETVVIGNSVTSIGERAFDNCAKLKSVVFPDSLTTIEYQGFANCTSLETVDFGNGLKDLGYGAFLNCVSLTSVVLPDSLTSVNDASCYDSGAFSGCKALKSAVIGNGLKKISGRTFYDCSSLETVIIGTSVTSIGERAFENCKELKSLYYLGDKPTIDEDAFEDASTTYKNYFPITASGFVASDNISNTVKTITVNTNGASTANYTKTTDWKYVTAPVIPEKEGHTFVCWCGSDGKEFDFNNTVVNSDITLTAKWSKNTYRLYFDPRGGSAPGGKYVAYGDSIGALPVATLSSDTFLGWYQGFNQSGKEYTSLSIMPANDIILYAAWKKNDSAITVLFDTDGGSIVAPQSLTSGATAQKPSAPTRTGYTFIGWYSDAEHWNAYDFSTPITNNTTIYAAWKSNSHVHIYFDYEITVAPTCTVSGKERSKCLYCDLINEKVVAPLGHDFSATWTVDKNATCSTAGSKSHHCTRCDTKADVTAINATGAHTYGACVIDKAAACTTDGSRHRNCTVCGNKATEAITKLGHNFSTEWTIDKAATTSAAGSKSHHCTRCNAKTDVTAIPKLPSATLAAPKLSSVKNTSTGVTVTWGKVSGATGYRVYRKASSEKSWTKIATITKRTTVSYTDKTAKSGTTYAYTVRGYNSAGAGAYNKTGLSIKYLAQPKVTAANYAKAVTVKWGKITGATGYIVYRKAGSAKSWTKLATITKNGTTSYTDKNVKSGTNYKYTVKAYYGKTYSSYTSGTAIKFLSPTTLKSAVSGKTGITLKFNKVTAGTGYIIYRKTGNGSYSRLATVSGNTKTTYVDKTAKKGKTYTYTVKVSNGKYYSANSNTKTCKDKY